MWKAQDAVQGGAQELPAETPSGLAYRMRAPRHDSAQSVTWEFSGGTTAPGGSPLSPASCTTPIDVEYRLQAVEDQQAVVLGELEALKGLGGQLSAWKGQMDAASARLAAVLDMAEEESAGFRQLPPCHTLACRKVLALCAPRPDQQQCFTVILQFGVWKDGVYGSCMAGSCSGRLQRMRRSQLAAVKESLCQLQRRPLSPACQPAEWAECSVLERLGQLEARHSCSESRMQDACAELTRWKQGSEAELAALQVGWY